MDVVVGWIRLKSGTRDELLTYAPTFTNTARAQPGILFCEIAGSSEDEDVAILTIGFADKASHDASVGSSHEGALIELLERIGVEATFENFTGDRGRIDRLTFGANARAQQLEQMRTR